MHKWHSITYLVAFLYHFDQILIDNAVPACSFRPWKFFKCEFSVISGIKSSLVCQFGPPTIPVQKKHVEPLLCFDLQGRQRNQQIHFRIYHKYLTNGELTVPTYLKHFVECTTDAYSLSRTTFSFIIS